MGFRHIEEGTVAYYQCNMFGEMTLGALVDVMMVTSGKQEKSLPEVGNFLRQTNFIWVMIQNEIEIHRLPRYNEKIVVETEAKEYNAFFTYRDFAIRDAQGELLVSATTAFTLIDYVNRNIVRIPPEIIAGYGVDAQKGKSKRIHFPKELATLSSQRQFQVEFLDIDANGHVNNTIYLKWLTNALGKSWFEQYTPQHLLIKYEKELVLGEQVKVISDLSARSANGSTPFKTEHIITGNTHNHSSAKVRWLSR